jgi:predicted nucleic acid-binding protein
MAAPDLDRALGATERVLLDSSTLLAFHAPQEDAHPLAGHLLRRIQDSGDPIRGYHSVVSASELLVRPIRSGESLTYMHAFLMNFPNLTMLPVDLPVAMQAASLRAVTNVRLADALIIASGLLAGCEAIVSNDAGWKRRCEPLFRQVRWIYLSDYL